MKQPIAGRSRVQAGVPSGGEFATEVKGENDDLAIDAADSFGCEGFSSERPEGLMGLPIKKPVSADIGPFLARLDADERAYLLNTLSDFAVMDTADKPGLQIFSLVVRSRMVNEGVIAKNVYLTPRRTDLEKFFAEHPLWEQDGITPHPTGGYVFISGSGPDMEYLDAEGRPHNEEGPALISKEDKIVGERGRKTWCIHGEITRADGLPAVVYSDGSQEWWTNGRKVAELTIREPLNEPLRTEDWMEEA